MPVADEARGLVAEIERGIACVTSFEPLPNAADAACSRLVALYAKVTGEERAVIREAGTPGQYRVLYVFGERMAVLAVRRADPELVFEGLVANAIEGFRWDPRENLMRLALLHHSATKLRADAPALFQRAASLAVGEVAAELRRRARKLSLPESKRAIATYGYEEAETANGFSYARDW